MPLRPLLNLTQIAVDPALAGRLPYQMALYYLALPLAQEDNQASLVMAHPENQTALMRLRDLLGVEIVPVRAAAGAIRDSIHRLYLPVAPAGEDAPAVAEPIPAGAGSDLETLLAGAAQNHYRITVASRRQEGLETLLREAARPVLLVGQPDRSLRKILLVIRGYSSDEYAIRWMIPLLRQLDTEIILLPLVDPVSNRCCRRFDAADPLWAHARECLQICQTGGIRATLRLRQGDPLAQIADEITEGLPDLLVIAAEGYGEFVGKVLAEVDRRPRHDPCTVLVMKPICQ